MITIQGIGQTKYGDLFDIGLSDLIKEATDKALHDAKIHIDQIDEVIISNMLGGEVSGQSHLGGLFASLYKQNIPCFRVEAACASGGVALMQAVKSLRINPTKKILVIGVEKMTDVLNDTITQFLMQASSHEEQKAGMTFPALFGMIARSYSNKYNLSDEARAFGSVLMHHNACANPLAQFQKPIEVQDILASPLIADPLHVFEASPVSDGAAALVLSGEESPKSSPQAHILSSSMSTDTLGLHERNTLTSLSSTQLATWKVFANTDLTVQDIDVMEVHDCFSISTIMAMEDIGLASQGMGADFIHDIYENNPYFLNPSGGLKAAGHPVGATGVRQVAEIALQLQNRACKRQVADAKYGLTHNLGGTGASCVMHVLTNQL